MVYKYRTYEVFRRYYRSLREDIGAGLMELREGERFIQALPSSSSIIFVVEIQTNV